MSESKKKIFGLLGLCGVALMTLVALLLPGQASAVASDGHTDVIRVTVYDRKPTVTFVSPALGHSQSSPLFKYHLSYSDTEHLYLTLSYWALNETTGQPELIETPLTSAHGDSWSWSPDPADLDEDLNYASGELSVDFNLSTCKIKFGEDDIADIPNCEAVRAGGIYFDSTYLPTDDEVLGYNCYGLRADVVSGGGMGTSNTSFCYLPSSLEQLAFKEDSPDPVVRITADQGAAELGLYIFDSDWQQINKEAIKLSVKDFSKQTGDLVLSLPFTSYGLASGEYYARIVTYDENSELIQYPERQYYKDANGELQSIPTAYFIIKYVAPDAPVSPNTGRFLASLGISRTDYILTGLVMLVFALGFAGFIMLKTKKDYRKNLHSTKKK